MKRLAAFALLLAFVFVSSSAFAADQLRKHDRAKDGTGTNCPGCPCKQ